MSKTKNFVDEFIKGNLLHTHPGLESEQRSKPWDNAVIVDTDDYDFVVKKFDASGFAVKQAPIVSVLHLDHVWIPAPVREELLDRLWMLMSEVGTLSITQHPNLAPKIKVLKDFIKASKGEADQFFVTGSIALALQGLFNPRHIHDIDFVVVNPSNEIREYVKILTTVGSMPENKNEDYPPTKEDTFFQFKLQDQIFNVFFVNQPEPDTYMHSDLPCGIANVRRILAAKKGYGRLKDRDQLMELSNFMYRDNDDRTIYAKAIKRDIEKKQKLKEEKTTQCENHMLDALAYALGRGFGASEVIVVDLSKE